MQEIVLRHLAALVAFDTQNPPREMDRNHAIFTYLNEQLAPAFSIETWDFGDGHVSWFARRGDPAVLFNVHLDTVPVGSGWVRSPLALTVEDERVYGRGSCDIKGAVAVLLALAQTTDLPLALLFTTDEEGANGCCVREFCHSDRLQAFQRVVVAEPTECRAVLQHRGYLSVKGEFSGIPGHSSEPRALTDSAFHKLIRWAEQALRGAAELPGGACFNVGSISGGGKSNVIAAQAQVHWSARLPPGSDSQAFVANITAPAVDAQWQVPFSGPPLPPPNFDTSPLSDWCGALDIPLGDAVDFWTEASLFSEAGVPAVVLGPGAIAQAHTADEWVTIAQLMEAAACYRRIAEHHD